MSGGYRDYANKRKVYIISSDGTVRSKRGWLGFRVRPGDTIIVPVDPDPNPFDITTFIADISTTLANIAAILVVIENNN